MTFVWEENRENQHFLSIIIAIFNIIIVEYIHNMQKYRTTKSTTSHKSHPCCVSILLKATKLFICRYLIQFYNVWMIQSFEDFNFTINLLKVTRVELTFINDFYGDLFFCSSDDIQTSDVDDDKTK